MEPSQESNKMIIVDYFSGETSQPKLSPQETKDRGLTDSPTEILPNLPSKIKEQKEQISILYQKIQAKTKKNKGCSQDEFFTKNRHYFIMTDGGLPVYSRYGDEVELNGIFATLSAMITKYTVFLSTNNNKEELNYIVNERGILVFLKKNQLIFMALSKKGDSISLLMSQLEYLYKQLMSILTNQFFERLKDNPSRCLTAMSGTDILFEQIIKFTSHTMVSLFNSYQVLPTNNRDKINKICEENRGDALLCVVLTPNEIVGISHLNSIQVDASDIILLQNLIFSSPSLRITESWVPFCMPGISEDGYLQLYCHFSDENIGVCLVTESVDPELFMKFSEQYKEINAKLMEGNFIDKIIQAQQKMSKSNKMQKNLNELTDDELIDELLSKLDIENDKNNLLENSKLSKTMVNIPNKPMKSMTVTNVAHQQMMSEMIMKDIIYGICKNTKMNQYFLINFHNSFHELTSAEKNLYKEYHLLLDKLEESNKNEENNKEKDFFHIEKGEIYTNVIQYSQHFLCIFSFNFFMGIEEIGKKMKEITKHIKDNENHYFIIFK